MTSLLWDVIFAPAKIMSLWSSDSKVAKAQAVGVGTLVAVKAAGAIIMWYNPWLFLEYGLPMLGAVGPTVASTVISGIKFVFM